MPLIDGTLFISDRQTGEEYQYSPNQVASAISAAYSTATITLDTVRTADAGTAINQAIAALGTFGGTILIPDGTWTIDTAVLISKLGITIRGVSPGATLLRFNGSNVPTAIKMADTTQRHCAIRELRIESNTDGIGTAIDASYFTNSLIDRVRIGGTGVAPNKGIIHNALGTYYNSVRDCRIQVKGAGSIGLSYQTTSNSNMASNVRIIGDASSTGVLVDSHSVKLERIDIEANCLIGIDVAANGHDCLIDHPYLEVVATGLRIASGVEAATMLSGFIADCTTANITDNGGVGFNILNSRVQYDPLTKIAFVGATSTAGPTITSGTGVPGFTAPKGSLFLRYDGGAGSTFYVNETGTSTWAAK